MLLGTNVRVSLCSTIWVSKFASQLRQDFLALEQHWLKLARSYELGERLGDFTEGSKPLRGKVGHRSQAPQTCRT